MDSVLRLQQFGPQVSNGHLLLLKRGEVLLGVWGSDAMVVPTQVVGSQACSSAEHRNASGKGQVFFSPSKQNIRNILKFKSHCRR